MPTDVKLPAGGGQVSYPQQFSFGNGDGLVIAGEARTFTVATNSPHNGYWGPGTPANGDTIEWKFLADAGTYTLKLHTYKGTNAGIVDFTLDGATLLSNVDFYDGSSGFNFLVTNTDLVIATSGLHTLRSVVDGKNASSSGFHFLPHRFIWIRTGD